MWCYFLEEFCLLSLFIDGKDRVSKRVRFVHRECSWELTDE
jgi:hypothetical protein